MFRGLGSANLQWLTTKVTRKLHGGGDIISKAGDASSDMYIVSCGEVRMFAPNDSGAHDECNLRQLGVLRTGDFFGEELLLEPAATARLHSVVASDASPAEILSINADTMQDLIERCPRVKQNILNISAKRQLANAEMNFSIYVAYGSETGTAEAVAELLYSNLRSLVSSKQLNVPVTLASLDDLIPAYSESQMQPCPWLQENAIICVVSSTFGVGDAPGNASKFKAWTNSLKNTCEEGAKILQARYSILGLGSRAYPSTFCKFADDCDQSLKELGASPLRALSVADELDGCEAASKSWVSNILQDVEQIVSTLKPDESEIELQCGHLQFAFELRQDATVFEGEQFDGVGVADRNAAKHDTLIRRETVTKSTGMDQLLRIDFKLGVDSSNAASAASGSPTPFEIGDHVGIFAKNDEVAINEVLGHLDISPLEHSRDRFTLVGDSRRVPKRLEGLSTTVFGMLESYIDLHNPGDQLIQTSLSSDPPILTRVFERDGRAVEHTDAEYPGMIMAMAKEMYLSLPMILKAFASPPGNARLPLQSLLQSCKWIRPRLYSVSSSPRATPSIVSLTVKPLTFMVNGSPGAQIGTERQGLCTSYLRTLSVGSQVEMFVKSCPSFHVPCQTLSCQPSQGGLILIGAGSGIAPFRGIWLERNATLGPVSMFFGFRKADAQAYTDEIAATVDDVWHCHVCFSREPGQPKMYVHDLIWEKQVEVWDRLKQGAHVYICGKPQMALEVEQMLGKIAMEQGDVNFSEAPMFVRQLQFEGRLHRDVFTET
eukprot:SAG22_NODE_387_length_11302_cov_333.169597_3_plen_774_part_00